MKTTVRPFDNGRGVQIRTKQPFMLSKNGIVGLSIPPSVVLVALKTYEDVQVLLSIALRKWDCFKLNVFWKLDWSGLGLNISLLFPLVPYITSDCNLKVPLCYFFWLHAEGVKHNFTLEGWKRQSLKRTSRISDESLKQTPRHQKTISTLLINIFACIVLIKFGF